MLEKIKSMFVKKERYASFDGNDEDTIDIFLHGAQLESCRISNYIFMKKNSDIHSALTKRDFVNLDFSNFFIVGDEIYQQIPEVVQYNEDYDIIIGLVQDKDWAKLNTCINIAEKTTDDVEMQMSIFTNAYHLINPSIK
jgi:hypothetical protein